jgi:CheY-like chemotaxis protein
MGKDSCLFISNDILIRSPLHGILGSTEVLRDLDLNSMASTLAGQIDSCGRTLLDIIDHLLDFATLKGQRVEKGVASSAKIRRRISLNESKPSVDDGLADVEASVALDDLTEEAVESTVYSFNCKKGTDYEPRTSVILDIDRSASNQWYCGIATGGWRRICINLITNALKYTPAGYIRVSLTQKPRPGSKRFDAVFTVSDSGKGMSKEFLENRLFQDFSQEDTLADGIGLGMHMVGRIIHAIGAKIEVVSEQSGPGAGTSVTVTVPLEHSQNRQNTNDTIDSPEISVQPILVGLRVNIIGHHSPPISEESRDSHLMSTAFKLAVASLEKSCDALGFRLHKGDSRDCDINFIFEPEFEYSVRAQDSEDRLRHFSRKPRIVICNSNPSGKTIKASRDKAIIRMGTAVEYIAMPCGIKTIARAITSALTRQKQLDATTPHHSVENQKPSSKSMLKHVNFKESDVTLSIQPEIAPREVVIRSATGSKQKVEESKRAEAVSSGQEPNAQRSPTVIPGHTSSNPKANSDEPTTTTSPKPPSPVLLLVDDNKVNLQLLTMYARKNKYAYLAATDGLMAFNAYQKAHEDSSSTPGAPSSTVPAVILMDINMPIMDGYEATQHIRTYEKKHQLPGAKIIALTALGSEAAYQEAFGSGCDMFLTKPVKLKDLTKIIEEM